MEVGLITGEATMHDGDDCMREFREQTHDLDTIRDSMIMMK